MGTNVIEVAEGRVRCVESDCGNQVCVQTGWVGSPGEMVVCLPHRLTVQVVADEARRRATLSRKPILQPSF